MIVANVMKTMGLSCIKCGPNPNCVLIMGLVVVVNVVKMTGLVVVVNVVKWRV